MPLGASEREATLRRLYADRRLAHRVLFKHKFKTPPHVDLMIDRIHSHGTQYALIEAFRDGAKSTTAEEAIAIMLGFRLIRNALILGANNARAAERLATVKHHIQKNDVFISLFGELEGPTWQTDRIVTATGLMVQALGRGQAILGVKHIDQRPDFFLADDIEDRESVRTPESRDVAHRWLMADVIPACDSEATGVVLATPRHPEDITGRIEEDARNEGSPWTVDKFPAAYLDEQGQLTAMWPERFPLARLLKIEESWKRQGLGPEFRMEYMLDAKAPEDRTFKPEMLRVEPRVRTWQAVYSMHDPARTVNRNSASTGYASWSWIGAKLVVWDSWARMLMPNEIVDSLFQINEEVHPVLIGIEEDGLNEWLLQPIRQEQVKRGVMLPLKAVKAPKGKIDFIRGLQPFASAREIEFAKDLPDLKSQLLSFPSGRIDAPNALAYALRMRPGMQYYEDFTAQNIVEDLEPVPGRPVWLCLNATPGLLTGMLLQAIEGTIRVFADWIREGEPAPMLSDIMQEANMEASRTVRLTAGPIHFERFNNFGMIQAAKRMPVEVRKGLTPEAGRPEIRAMLRRIHRGLPALMVSSSAHWTLNGFSGGYCREMDKHGRLADFAVEGPYRTLMEGLESFMGLFKTGSPDEEEYGNGVNYATTSDGRRYISARVQR